MAWGYMRAQGGGTGANKKQPIATIYNGRGGATMYTIAESYNDSFFSAESGTLTCLKAGKYKIVSSMRCRYCLYDTYVNNEPIIHINGMSSENGSTLFRESAEITLETGDVITGSSSIYGASTDKYAVSAAEIYKM